MEWYLEVAMDSIRESAYFVGACAAIALGGPIFFNASYFNALGLVLLIVSAGLMLVGGGLSFVTPGNVKMVNALANAKLKPEPEDYRRTKHKAALYSITGVLLFAYSLLLAGLTP